MFFLCGVDVALVANLEPFASLTVDNIQNNFNNCLKSIYIIILIDPFASL